MNYQNSKLLLLPILAVMSLLACGGADPPDALMSKQLGKEIQVVLMESQFLADGGSVLLPGVVESTVPANTELQRLIAAGITFTPQGCATFKAIVDETGEWLITIGGPDSAVVVLVAGKDVERAKTLGFFTVEGTAETYFAETFECSSRSL
jgi:hypothetical protein